MKVSFTRPDKATTFRWCVVYIKVSVFISKMVNWSLMRRILGSALVCILLAGGGMWLGTQLNTQAIASITSINLLLTFSLILLRWLKAPTQLQFACLLGLSFGLGIIFAQLPLGMSRLYLSGLLLVGVLGGVIYLATRQSFDFERFSMVLGILALVFSLLGVLLVYAQGLWWLSALWAILALLCLSVILYTLCQHILHSMVNTDLMVGISGVVLLTSGVFLNLNLFQLALG